MTVLEDLPSSRSAKQATMHLPKNNMYKCNLCHKVFKSKHGLTQHERIKHNSAQTFKCQTCSNEFAVLWKRLNTESDPKVSFLKKV